MRQIKPYAVWVGHAGSAPDQTALGRNQILAVVDLAIDEAPRVYGRETIVCRFPLTDGAGNDPALIQAAVATVAGLIRTHTRTLVYCSMGLSRSPSIVAGGLALATGRSPVECLAEVTRDAPADVSPSTWGQVQAAVAAIRAQGVAGSVSGVC